MRWRRGRVVLGLAVTATVLSISVVPAFAAGSDGPDSGVEIVGGGEATPGEYPFMVALVSASQPDAYLGQFCGGSVVAPTWVLTAAHCVERTSPSSVDLVIGRHNLRNDDGERIGAQSITIHPNYDRRLLTNDLALIELESATAAAPVGLASAANAGLWEPGTIATVMGWGFTESTPSYPEVLYEVDVPIVSDAECDNTINGNIDDAVMICAGDVANGGVDSCGGDSGGPLVVPDGTGGYFEVGIVSWGFGCADANAPGVYTEVAAFSAWIEGIVGDDPPPPPPPSGDHELLVSVAADRSDPVALDGATVAGDIYAFVSPDDGISSVTFTVDGVRPRTDDAAPFDLAGTSGRGDARPYRTGRLGAGDHVAEAVITFADGSTETITATFTVE